MFDDDEKNTDVRHGDHKHTYISCMTFS